MSLRINEGLAGFWVSRGPGIPQCAVSEKFHAMREDAEKELNYIRMNDEIAAAEWMRKYEAAIKARQQGAR